MGKEVQEKLAVTIELVDKYQAKMQVRNTIKLFCISIFVIVICIRLVKIKFNLD